MRTANLIVKDEVNVKIEGLDLEARKRLSNKFKYSFFQTQSIILCYLLFIRWK